MPTKPIKAAPKKVAAKTTPKKAVVKKSEPKVPAAVKYNFNEQEVLEKLFEGESLKAIARFYKATFSVLWTWCHAEPDRSARVRAAMEHSAYMYAEKAEAVLLMAEENAASISKARELAQHYRWMSKVRAPRVFGDKVDIKSEVSGNLNVAMTDEQAQRIAREVLGGDQSE